MSRIIAIIVFVSTISLGAAAEGDPAAIAERFWTGMKEMDKEAIIETVTAASLEGADLDQEPEEDSGIETVSIGEATTAGGSSQVATTVTAEGQKIDFKTVVVQEDGAWKVDLGQTMGQFMQAAMAQAMAEQGGGQPAGAQPRGGADEGNTTED